MTGKNIGFVSTRFAGTDGVTPEASKWAAEHVVINSFAQEELAHRKGLSSIIIPNVLDFAQPPVTDSQKTRHFRESIGLGPDEICILQPTRVVARKGIEHAIDLVSSLGDPRCKLVISHEAGDEGHDGRVQRVRDAGGRGRADAADVLGG